MSAPMISVVMPTYNSEKYVAEAVESILTQTFGDFEFLIINEYGSDDATAGIINSFHDPRIRVIQNTRKLGVSESLNEGLRRAKGKYIARMDSDDISVRYRFEKQVNYMESNPHIGILGGWQKAFGLAEYTAPVFEEHRFIKASMFFRCSIWHATVFFRRDEVFEHGLFYNPDFLAEDYELWLRAVDAVQCANLQEVLVHYRLSEDNRTNQVKARMVEQRQELFARSLEQLAIRYERDFTLDSWYAFYSKNPKSEWRKRLLKLEDLLKRIIQRNLHLGIYDHDAFSVCANRYWLHEMDAPGAALGSDARLPLELISDVILRQAEAKVRSGNLCFYGLGRIGLAALPYFKEHFAERLICVSDGDPAKWGRVFCGCECISQEALPKDTAIFIAAGYEPMTEIEQRLRELGHTRVFPYTQAVL